MVAVTYFVKGPILGIRRKNAKLVNLQDLMAYI